MGRKLAGVDNGKKTQYFYDHTGARVKKVVDGTVTEYHVAGDLIASETSNGKTMWYIYDSGANLLAVNIDGKYYIYVRNIQNDIIALVDASGRTVVNYTYDSWGKLLSITGSLKDTVGVQNPFRYRGYYYDNETGMYYLKNRYYDPELRRFISADTVTTATASMETLHNRNLYAYCGENPLMRKDCTGDIWGAAIAAFCVGAVVSLATQIVSGDKISWIAVGTSGLTTAMGFVGSPVIAQAIVSAVGGIMGSYFEEKKTIEESVFNGAVDGVVTGILSARVKGGYSEYVECTNKYYKACERVKEANLGNLKTIKLLETERMIYKRNIWGIGKVNADSYVVSTTLSNGTKSVGKAIAKLLQNEKLLDNIDIMIQEQN